MKLDTRQCPFCGSYRTEITDNVLQYHPEQSKTSRYAKVYCKHCGARGPQIDTAGKRPLQVIEAAVQAWNGEIKNGICGV